jgi:hypothetical protein
MPASLKENMDSISVESLVERVERGEPLGDLCVRIKYLSAWQAWLILLGYMAGSFCLVMVWYIANAFFHWNMLGSNIKNPAQVFVISLLVLGCACWVAWKGKCEYIVDGLQRQLLYWRKLYILPEKTIVVASLENLIGVRLTEEFPPGDDSGFTYDLQLLLTRNPEISPLKPPSPASDKEKEALRGIETLTGSKLKPEKARMDLEQVKIVTISDTYEPCPWKSLARFESLRKQGQALARFLDADFFDVGEMILVPHGFWRTIWGKKIGGPILLFCIMVLLLVAVFAWISMN